MVVMDKGLSLTLLGLIGRLRYTPQSLNLPAARSSWTRHSRLWGGYMTCNQSDETLQNGRAPHRLVYNKFSK